ncbi:MAG: hypothetical protein RL616_2699 [Verrucomicrobiota bacterium]
MEAANKRQQRDAQKRQRELERQAKEMAKMSQAEQARLEVETFENGCRGIDNRRATCELKRKVC